MGQMVNQLQRAEAQKQSEIGAAVRDVAVLEAQVVHQEQLKHGWQFPIDVAREIRQAQRLQRRHEIMVNLRWLLSGGEAYTNKFLASLFEVSPRTIKRYKASLRAQGYI